ncbi:MAG: bifunctional metallophosphatase/5'-nucleotidase [Chthoniobacterales bacterium]
MNFSSIPQCLRRLLKPTAAALLVAAGVSPAKAQFNLTILHNNDGESKLIGDSPAGFGGAAYFTTVLKAEATLAANAGNAVVTISSGDNFLAGKTFAASLSNGTFYDAIAISAANYDAITLGNHDFDFGPDTLADFINEVATGTYVSANLDFAAEPNLQALVTGGRIAPSVVVTKGGEQIGIIGLTTPTITNISSPRNVVVNDDVAAAAQTEIARLESLGIKHIIISSHLQGIETEKALVAQLSGVDVVIAGGGDEILANPGSLLLPDQTPADTYPVIVKNADGVDVPIVTTNGEYRYVGRLDVTFDASGNVTGAVGNPVRVARNDVAVPPADAVAADLGVQMSAVDPVEAFVANLNANVIGANQADLDGRRNSIRGVETNLGNLVADAFLNVAQKRADKFGVDAPQVALANGGGIRNGSVIPPGPLSEGTTFDVNAFSNFLAVVPDVPIATFKSLLENSYSQTVRDGNGDIVPQGSNTGRFAQISGFQVIYNLQAPGSLLSTDGTVISDGSRVKDVFLNTGQALILDGEIAPGAPASVDVVTSAFLAGGGDGYPFGGLPFTTLGITDQQSLLEFIQTDLAGTVTSASYGGPRGRILSVSQALPPEMVPPTPPTPPEISVQKRQIVVRKGRNGVKIRGSATSNAFFVLINNEVANGINTFQKRFKLNENRRVTKFRVRAVNSAGQFSRTITVQVRQRN